MPNDIHHPNNPLTADGKMEEPVNPKKLKWKRFKGLIEWICDREGHDFLIAVDRSYIRNSFNHFGLKEKFFSELNIQCEKS